MERYRLEMEHLKLALPALLGCLVSLFLMFWSCEGAGNIFHARIVNYTTFPDWPSLKALGIVAEFLIFMLLLVPAFIGIYKTLSSD